MTRRLLDSLRDLSGPFWTQPGPLRLWDVVTFGAAAMLAVVIVYHPIVFTREYYYGSGTDLPGLQYPVHHYAFTWLRQGILPLWNPFCFGGIPFHAGAHPVTYPPMWAGLLVSTQTEIWLSIVFHALVGMVGCACLLRFLGHARLVCLLVGLSFGVGGFYTGHLFAGHLDLTAAYAYLPWIALSWLAAARYSGFGWTVLGALVLAWTGLIGNYQMLHQAVLGCSALLLGQCALGSSRRVPPWTLTPAFQRDEMLRGDDPVAWLGPAGLRERARDTLWLLARLGVMLALTAGLLGFQLGPLWAARDSFHLILKNPDEAWIPLGNWWTYLIPHAFERTFIAYSFTRWATWEGQPYVGILTILCALFAFAGARRRWLLPAMGVAVAGLLASGSATPLFAWYSRVDPIVGWFEVPGRFIGVMTLFLCILAAQGLSSLLLDDQVRERKWRRGTTLAVLVLMLGLWTVLFHADPKWPTWGTLIRSVTTEQEWEAMLDGRVPEQRDSLLVVSSLRVGWTTMLVFLVFLCVHARGRPLANGLVGLVLVDLLTFAYPYLATAPASAFLMHGEVARYLRGIGPYRWTAPEALVKLNSGMALGLSNPGGYDMITAVDYDRAVARQLGLPSDARLPRMDFV
ncbi:MAG: hypothetical protein AB1758_20195, partial [Candidatus Eremiobacterota bacterium]